MKKSCHIKNTLSVLIFVLGMAISLVANAQTPTATRARNTGSSGTSSSTNTASSFTRPDINEETPDSAETTEPQGIIFDNDEEADSILRMKVMAIEPAHRSVKMTRLENPVLDPTGVQLCNAAQKMDGNFYLDLGALGQCQSAINPFSVQPKSLSARFAPDIHPAYRQLHRMKMFQTQTPYTLLSYNSSLNKDYQMHIIHSQNIKPRWNVAFLYDLVSRDGLYTNSDVTNHVIDITTNYYSSDSRYQLQAGLTNNRLRQQENGGVQDDATCWDYPRESGVPVNMYNAQNEWRDFEIWVHQSYNTVRQFEYLRPRKTKIKDTVSVDTTTARAESGSDSIQGIIKAATVVVQERDSIIGFDTIRPPKPHTYNTGVLALDVNLSRHRRTFYDNQTTSWFYNQSALDTSFFYDSTTHYRLAAELYWTNDAYMSHRWKNPFVLLVGIRPEYNRVCFAEDTLFSSFSISDFTVAPFARALFRIGEMELSAQAEEVNGGHRTGDYRLSAQLQMYDFKIEATSEAISPDLIFYHNNEYYKWNLAGDSFRKTKRQQIKAEYSFDRPLNSKGHLKSMDIFATSSLISDNVWFSSSMLPVQGDENALLTQAQASTSLQFGWFNIRLQEMLQYSNNDAVVRVPLFASKNSMFADFTVFRGALRVQTGFDLRYHTKYKADGWNPVLGAFYRQDDVEVGNYLVADYWINLQIKRASIYLKASHFNAPIEELLNITPTYFSLPHYPLENFGLYWGLTWKFFN